MFRVATLNYHVGLRFVVWQLENGRKKYGIGINCQLYVVVDRTPSNYQKESSSAASAASQNLPILKAIFSVVQV